MSSMRRTAAHSTLFSSRRSTWLLARPQNPSFLFVASYMTMVSAWRLFREDETQAGALPARVAPSNFPPNPGPVIASRKSSAKAAMCALQVCYPGIIGTCWRCHPGNSGKQCSHEHTSCDPMITFFLFEFSSLFLINPHSFLAQACHGLNTRCRGYAVSISPSKYRYKFLHMAWEGVLVSYAPSPALRAADIHLLRFPAQACSLLS